MRDKDNLFCSLVSLAIEQALIDFNPAVLDKVATRLYEKYQCKIEDCYRHPDYLHDVLKHLFGNSYNSILASIRAKLDEFSYQEPISKFLGDLER